MLFSPDRDKLRLMYVEAWHKRLQGLPLQALEAMIADVVAMHPEYHPLLEDQIRTLSWEDDKVGGTTNPFLHMGLHLALREQVSIDRPTGIRTVYTRLCTRLGDVHEAEHRMLTCLLETLASAGPDGPDEQTYLACLQKQL